MLSQKKRHKRKDPAFILMGVVAFLVSLWYAAPDALTWAEENAAMVRPNVGVVVACTTPAEPELTYLANTEEVPPKAVEDTFKVTDVKRTSDACHVRIETAADTTAVAFTGGSRGEQLSASTATVVVEQQESAVVLFESGRLPKGPVLSAKYRDGKLGYDECPKGYPCPK